MRILVALALVLLLSACNTADDPRPTAEQSPSPGATTQSTTSAPELEPTIDVEPLPSPSGWSPRPQTVGEGDEPDTPWATERDVEEAMAIWASYACVERSSMPTPSRVTEGAFTTQAGDDAVVEVIEFSTASDGTAFVTGYVDGSIACETAQPVSDRVLVRDIAGSTWTEVLVEDGTTITMVIVSAELSAEEAAGVAQNVA